jgi:hypothetical protein
LADSRHDLLDDGFHSIGWQGEGLAIGNDSYGFAGTVHDHLTGLALVQVLLQAGTEAGIGLILYVVPKFDQELSATKHRAQGSF